MAEYIEREAVLAMKYAGIVDVADIKAIPAADVAPVVRCKDCRFCEKHPTSDEVKLCTNETWNTLYYPLVEDDGFCSFGERKDGKQDD